ncbi:MAG: hypothetical protein HY824_09805 [Acidobacteria bacterium]|nr:hypothetical protein [Acidobacteriota bacterium]
MIRTAVTILVVLVVLNAIGHAGMVAWRYYELEDEAQQLVVFGAAVATDTLVGQIVEKARELDVPLEPEDVEVRRDGNRTIVAAFYTEDVQLFPSFTYPIDLSLSVESIAVTGVAPSRR